MTTSTYTAEPPGGRAPVAFAPGSDADRSSRFWRTVWRFHFYAGMIAMPVLLLLAVTGLIILYTGPINDVIHRDLLIVDVGDERVPLDDQREAVAAAHPDWEISGLFPPSADDRATVFSTTTESGSVRLVSVDPYTNEVLGSRKEGNDIIGLANRLHATLNNETVTIPLPTLPGIFGDAETGGVLQDVALGDVLLEIFAVWGLTLALSGIYLWWPRKRGTGKALIVPRLGKRGRARWRDVHAVSGIVLSGILVFFVVTGLPWSAVWGGNWFWLAEQITPAKEAEEPVSTVAEVGDLDRFGNPIPWALTEEGVPASDEPDQGAGAPAPLPLDEVARVAQEEGMKGGYSIALPADVEAEDGTTTYGTYVLANPWPTRIENERTVYVDQFSGDTLGESTPADLGRAYEVTELGINTHMGTQFGLLTRIIMTTGCLLLIVSATTALIMFFKRRPKGQLGLPRRPTDVRLQTGLIALAIGLALIYPLWGVTLLIVLLVDVFVIQRIGPLRRAFGMRT